MKQHIKWYTGRTIYVDANTGEEITKHVAKQHYKIIKTDTYHEFNANKTIGFRQHTHICRNKQQGEIQFPTD